MQELLEACEELFCLVVLPSNYSEPQRQEILTRAREVMKRAKQTIDGE